MVDIAKEVISLITGLVSLATAIILYRANRKSKALRAKALTLTLFKIISSTVRVMQTLQIITFLIYIAAGIISIAAIYKAIRKD